MEDGTKSLDIDTKIYPLDVIYSVAYIFLDKYYVLLEGDPKEKIQVKLTAKDNKAEISKAIGEFKNNLITHSLYKKQSEKNSAIRQLILQAALFPVEQSAPPREQKKEISETDKIELPKEFENADY